MSKLPKKYKTGFGEVDPDINSFLAPETTDYYKHEASGAGYNARWSDNYDDARSAVGFSEDDPVFRSPSWTGDTDAPHQDLTRVIDGSQPYDPRLPGGAPLTKGIGIGDGKPRFAANNIGPSGQKNWDSRGGRDRTGGRR